MAAGGGAFPPGRRGQICPGSREGGSWQDPQGGPEGGPGGSWVGPQILVGLDNVIKRASPESRSSDDVPKCGILHVPMFQNWFQTGLKPDFKVIFG